MMALFKTLALFVVIVYGAISLLLYVFQRHFLYFPTPHIDHPFQTEHFQRDDESLAVVVLNSGQNKALLYFGGNGEQVVGNAVSFMRAFQDCTIYLVNYRGYGGSSGKPAEKAILADAEFVYGEIAMRHRYVAVAGRSLGSGVATHLASRFPVWKLLLITPFDSIRRLAEAQFPAFPVGLLLKDSYDSIDNVPAIQAPTLVVIAERDEMIPRESSMRLVRAFPASQLRLEIIESAGHNDLSLHGRYHQVLADFLET